MSRRQWARDIIHNCIVHPMRLVLPRPVWRWVHEWNAAWAFPDPRDDDDPIPDMSEALTEADIVDRLRAAGFGGSALPSDDEGPARSGGCAS